MRHLMAILLLLGIPYLLAAQIKPDSITGKQKLKKAFLDHKDSNDSKYLNADTLASHAAQLDGQQFKTIIALEKQKLTSIEDDRFAMKHRWRSFDFQYTASIIIFILVILIVITGLFFSGWQFRVAMKQVKLKEKIVNHATTSTAENVKAETPLGGNKPDAWAVLKSELEISATGIKVNSSLLGVIILALSIAFFYLYIIYVYPIKYINYPETKEEVVSKPTT